MTIRRLARMIDADLNRKKQDLSLTLDRAWENDPKLGLRPHTVDELTTFHGRLSRAIPENFDYSITFEDGKITDSLELTNGPMAGAYGLFPVPLDRNFLENLRNLDWEDTYTEMNNRSEAFDEMMEPSGPVPDWFLDHIASGGK